MNSPVKIKKSVKKAAEAPADKKSPVVTKHLVLKPRISEKGYAQSELHNTYIFDIPTDSNKFDVGKAVASQFDVTVTGVRVAAVPGKTIRAYRQRGRKSISAQRSDTKKAYVTLKAGDKLPIFAAVEDAEVPKETK
ncbi:50S ribosomal protein L23 [Candidatus Saccharibacteria bacterium]|nr:50S ribosomal protein L23 [Candidatus Saccharibacteria bacterium]